MSAPPGGKYSRELKLRVLEHFFRNGGHVFGNKQSTAKKFGVDIKTVSRFLKAPDLVRLARKNARSSGKSAGSNVDFKFGDGGGSSGGGGGGSGGRSVRINLPAEEDESLLNQSSPDNLSSVDKLIKVFQLGTQELRDLLVAECDLVYECRVCRGLFRCLANLVAHKRQYCTRAHRDTRQVFGDGPGQSLSAGGSGVVVLPLPERIDRLPEVVRADEAAARAAAAAPLPTVHLQPLAGTTAAVLQTVGHAPPPPPPPPPALTPAQQAELEWRSHAALAAEQLMSGEQDRHVCTLCNTTFSTRKTLSQHVRSLHASTRIYYPCTSCSAAFVNMFSVERHLQKAHKKKAEEIETLRPTIRQRSFQRHVNLPAPAADATAAAAAPAPAAETSSSSSPMTPAAAVTPSSAATPTAPAQLSADLGSEGEREDAEELESEQPTLSQESEASDPVPLLSPHKKDTSETLVNVEKSGSPRDNHELGPPSLEPAHEDDKTDANQPAPLHKDGDTSKPEEQMQVDDGGDTTDQQTQEEPMLEEKSQQDPAPEVEPPTSPIIAQQRPPASPAARAARDDVKARGYPTVMKPLDQVRRSDFIYANQNWWVCTLCDKKFKSVKAVHGHMSEHSISTVREFVAQHSVDGMVAVPAADVSEHGDDAAEPLSEDEQDEQNEDEDADIEAGAKLLVSCKLWSPGNQRAADDSDSEQETDMEEDERPVPQVDPLVREVNGQMVNKWDVMRPKGDRFRCTVCHRQFVRRILAEQHLQNDHSFKDIHSFLSLGTSTDQNDNTAIGHAGGTTVTSGEKPTQKVSTLSQPNASAKPKSVSGKIVGLPFPPPPPGLLSGLKRPATGRPPAAKVMKTAAQAVLKPVGHKTEVLRVARSDLLARRGTDDCECLVCSTVFTTHALAAIHMKQHSDGEILDFVRSKGSQILPILMQKHLHRQGNAAAAANALNASRSVTSGKSVSAGVKNPDVSATAGSSNTSPKTAAKPTLMNEPNTAGVVKPAQSSAVAVSSKSSVAETGEVSAAPSAGNSAVTPATSHRPHPADSPDATAPESEAESAASSDSATWSNRDGLELDDAVREHQMFDKTQLLQKRSDRDGARCLLCAKEFNRYSSACGHLAQHSDIQVRRWRRQMCNKATALLSKTKATASPAPAQEAAARTDESEQSEEQSAPSTQENPAGLTGQPSAAQPERQLTPPPEPRPAAQTERQNSPQRTEQSDVELKQEPAPQLKQRFPTPTATAARDNSAIHIGGMKPGTASVRGLLLTPSLLKPIRTLENVAKRLKASHSTMERIDYKTTGNTTRSDDHSPSPDTRLMANATSSTIDALVRISEISRNQTAEMMSTHQESPAMSEAAARNFRTKMHSKSDWTPHVVSGRRESVSSTSSSVDPTAPELAKSQPLAKPDRPTAHTDRRKTSTSSDKANSNPDRSTPSDKANSEEGSKPVKASHSRQLVKIETMPGASQPSAVEKSDNEKRATDGAPSATPPVTDERLSTGASKALRLGLSRGPVSGGRPAFVAISSAPLAGVSTVMVTGKQLMKLAVVSSTPDASGKTVLKLAPAMPLPGMAAAAQLQRPPARPAAPGLSPAKAGRPPPPLLMRAPPRLQAAPVTSHAAADPTVTSAAGPDSVTQSPQPRTQRSVADDGSSASGKLPGKKKVTGDAVVTGNQSPQSSRGNEKQSWRRRTPSATMENSTEISNKSKQTSGGNEKQSWRKRTPSTTTKKDTEILNKSPHRSSSNEKQSWRKQTTSTNTEKSKETLDQSPHRGSNKDKQSWKKRMSSTTIESSTDTSNQSPQMSSNKGKQSWRKQPLSTTTENDTERVKSSTPNKRNSAADARKAPSVKQLASSNMTKRAAASAQKTPSPQSSTSRSSSTSSLRSPGPPGASRTTSRSSSASSLGRDASARRQPAAAAAAQRRSASVERGRRSRDRERRSRRDERK